MALQIDPTQIFVALIGFLGVGLGLVLSLKGQRRQETQQQVANRLAERKQEADEQDRLVTRLYAEIDRLNAVIDRLRTANDADRDACDRARDELVGTVTLLAGMVRDEAAREAARFAIDQAARHDTDH